MAEVGVSCHFSVRPTARMRKTSFSLDAMRPASQPQHQEQEDTNADAMRRGSDASESSRLAFVHPRRSLSPRLRADVVMEKIMNPFLDRDTPETPLSGHSLDLQLTIPGTIVAEICSATPEDYTSSTKLPPHVERKFSMDGLPYVKAKAFDDNFHSVYVAPHPTGLYGLFVLMQSPILLMGIGLFSGAIGLFIDFWLAKISIYHNVLSDWGFRYFAASALFAVCGSAALTYLLSPQASGSGLPFIKVAISGIDMSEYLSFRCVSVKIVGLLLAFTAGLSIGKEGPFIMISCGFAHVMMKTKLFERIYQDETKRLEMLACACSAGVAATFGSPFGGVLFGVEVTSHFYMVRTLPRSFFAAIVGALLVNFVTENSRYGLFGSSNLGISETNDLHSFTVRDLAVFILMGVICGLGGALFNYCISVLVRLRDIFLQADQFMSHSHGKLARFWNGLGKRLMLVIVITYITCFTEFYGDSAWFIRHGSPRRILAALFTKDKHPFHYEEADHFTEKQAQEDAADSVLLSRSLVTFLPLKFVLTLVSVVLPIPAGLFTPTFVIGGIFGRLIGEAINAFDLLTTQYQPYEYAIIGAGAFSSGVTHAISTAVIIMEISHNDGLNLPVSIAILASYFTAKRFTDNVYDMLISTSKMPRLRKLPKAAYDIPSWEVMRDVNVMRYLTADSSYAEAHQVLQTSKEPVFPIVDSHSSLFLLATVTRGELAAAVDECQNRAPRHSNSTNSRHHDTYNDPDATENATSASLPMNATIAVNSGRSTASLVFRGYGSPAHEDEYDDVWNQSIHFAFRRGGRVMNWVSCVGSMASMFVLIVTLTIRVVSIGN